MKSFRTILVAGLVVSFASLFARSGASAYSPDAASMQRKLEHIQRNGVLVHPNARPTDFTEAEVNAYFASGAVKLPQGVQTLLFQAKLEVIIGLAQVDFDKLKSGRNSANPLLGVFSGVHEVAVVAHAHGSDGEGYVEVDSVSLDDVEIPRFVLQIFVDKYLKPKYPNVGLDSRFPLPNKISTAVVGSEKITLRQK